MFEQGCSYRFESRAEGPRFGGIFMHISIIFVKLKIDLLFFVFY